MIKWTHRRVARALPAYRLGHLSARSAARVEAHLARCPACRADLEGQRALSAVLRRADPAAMVPEPATEHLITLLRRAPASPAAARGLRWTLTPLAAACLFLGGVAAGGRFYARVETRQVVREVPVERVVERVVERIVEKRVEVPVPKVVYRPVVRVETRWRTRPSPGASSGARPAAAGKQPETVRVSVPDAAATATAAARPASVRF